MATLLEAGADVNKDDGDPEVRYTPLHSAVAREVRSQADFSRTGSLVFCLTDDVPSLPSCRGIPRIMSSEL